MIVVKNLGLCNLRIELNTEKRFLIPAGGQEVSLPNKIEEVEFFKTLVDNKTLEIVRTIEDKKEKKKE